MGGRITRDDVAHVARLARLRLTTVGSVHPTVAQALVRLEEARTRLLEAETMARGAIDAADQYRALI